MNVINSVNQTPKLCMLCVCYDMQCCEIVLLVEIVKKSIKSVTIYIRAY